MDFPDALNPIRSLKATWRAVAQSPGPLIGWWGVGLGALILVYALLWIPMVMLRMAGQMENGDLRPALAGVVVIVMCLGMVVLIVGQCWWRIGFVNLLADTLRTGRSDFASAWKPRGRLLRVLGTTLLMILAILALELPAIAVSVVLGVFGSRGNHIGALEGMVVLVLGLLWLCAFVYCGLGFSFAPTAALLDDVGPLEAFSRSWRAARGRRLALFVFWFGTWLAAISGFLAFCIGYLATLAFLELMPAEAYLALTRPDEVRTWWISTGTVSEPAEAGDPWPEAPPAG